jgi:hypothetical protein
VAQGVRGLTLSQMCCGHGQGFEQYGKLANLYKTSYEEQKRRELQEGASRGYNVAKLPAKSTVVLASCQIHHCTC